MTTITKLIVIIEPSDYLLANRLEKVLRVYVETDTCREQVGRAEILPDDDLHSYWEVIWERAGREIKDRLLELANEKPKDRAESHFLTDEERKIESTYWSRG